MKNLVALSLVTVLGLSLAPAAYAQEYGSVDYDRAAAAAAVQPAPAPVRTGRSAYVAPRHAKIHTAVPVHHDR